MTAPNSAAGVLVLDAYPHGLRVTHATTAGEPGRTIVTDPARLLNELHATSAADIGLIVHRIPHAPDDTPEVVDDFDADAVRVAGRAEAAGTELRLRVWDAARKRWPEHRQVAVFDDVWFRGLPEVAKHAAIPAELEARHRLERRGRHGPLHRLAAERAGAARVVSVLLGPEASVAAVRDGQPLEISAGVTALSGIPGGRTCGDLDPAVVLYLADNLGFDLDTIERLLSVEGGLSGLGDGPDTLAALRAAGTESAELALRHQLHRVRRYIGAYAALLDGLDAVVVSGEDDDCDDRFLEELAAGLAYLGVGERVPLTASGLSLPRAIAITACAGR